MGTTFVLEDLARNTATPQCTINNLYHVANTPQSSILCVNGLLNRPDTCKKPLKERKVMTVMEISWWWNVGG